jgi:hypothetical protein
MEMEHVVKNKIMELGTHVTYRGRNGKTQHKKLHRYSFLLPVSCYNQTVEMLLEFDLSLLQISFLLLSLQRNNTLG